METSALGLGRKPRLLVVAPHPDDESLACGVLLQKAVRAGAAIRVVYATDGDNNPWPQRLLERKWKIKPADRKRWGRMRRGEAIAALKLFGVEAGKVEFLGYSDQKLTSVLLADGQTFLERLALILATFKPTHLVVPSIGDAHPDHNAIAVMLRLLFARKPDHGLHTYSYMVHGKSESFLHRASPIHQSEEEQAKKVEAIRCHRSQLKLSSRRFLAYASRAERFRELRPSEASEAEGSIRAFLRDPDSVCLRIAHRKQRANRQLTLFLAGEGEAGPLCATLSLRPMTAEAELVDYATGESLGVARYHGTTMAGELSLPIDSFCPDSPLFVKLNRKTLFFDEAGWLEIAPLVRAEVKSRSRDAQLVALS